MSKKLNLKLFSKYYWGIASDEEKDEIYNSEESIAMFREQWDNFASIKSEHESVDHEKITREIKSNLMVGSKTSDLRKLGNFILKYAASIFIPLFAIGTLYFLLVMRPNMISSVHLVEKINPKGQRSELILPDGSKVWLNAQSKITYPEKFVGKYRIINLEGEAFFDVIKNPKKPFIVKTEKLEIEVLGTSFNVMAYKEDNLIKTTLVKGKVSVRRFNPKTKRSQKAILTPNHQAVFYKDKEKFVLDQVDVTKYTLWKQGIIVFDNEPLIQIVRVLERWYNLEIELDPELEHKYNYTITITDESIDEVLKLIKKTTPLVNINQTENNHIKISLN